MTGPASCSASTGFLTLLCEISKAACFCERLLQGLKIGRLWSVVCSFVIQTVVHGSIADTVLIPDNKRYSPSVAAQAECLLDLRLKNGVISGQAAPEYEDHVYV